MLADGLLPVGAEFPDLVILPTNDLCEVLVGLFGFDLQPAVLFGVMHRVDRFEERLRRHATGIDAERCVVRVVAHKKQNSRPAFRSDPSGRETSRAAAQDCDRFHALRYLSA